MEAQWYLDPRGLSPPRTPAEGGSGQSLAVAYSTKALCLISSHTGKMVHRIDCSAYSNSEICCLGWGVNFIDDNATALQLSKLRPHLGIDDVINQNPEIRALDVPPDLPRDLAQLEVEAVLPRLSPLSFDGLEQDSRRTLTDASTDSL